MADNPSVDPQELVEETEFNPGDEAPPSQPVNGHSIRPSKPEESVLVSHSYKAPVPVSQLPGYRRPSPPRPAIRVEEAPNIKSTREFFDNLMGNPDSMDYKIVIHRYAPAVLEGTNEIVPKGKIHECEVMPYESLREEITRAWGGGEYRVCVCDSSGVIVPRTEAKVISIPTSMHPPKLRKFAGIVDDPTPSTIASAGPADMELEAKTRELEHQAKLDLLAERQSQAEARRTEAEIKAAYKKKELEKLQRDLSGTNESQSSTQMVALQQQISSMQTQFLQMLKEEREAAAKKQEAIEERIRQEREHAEKRREDAERNTREERDRLERLAKEERVAIERQIKEDRESAERRANEERALTREMFKNVTDSIARLSEKPKDDSSPKFFEIMQQSSIQAQESQSRLLAALLPALTQKPEDKEGRMMELVKLNNDANRQTMELAIKRDTKDSSMQQQLFNTLLTTVLSPKRDGLSPEMILKLIGEGREQAMAIYERTEARNAGMQPPDGPDEDGYDPKIGLLGNAGKAIFQGLQGLMNAAAQNPAFLDVVAKLLGKRNPTPADMAAYAWQVENNGGATPPPVRPLLNPPPLQPQQQQLYPPQQNYPQGMVGATPPPVRPPQQFAPPQQQVVVAPPPIAPPVQQQQPTPADIAPAPEMPRQVTQAEIDMATQMEGEMSGVAVDPAVALPSSEPPQAQAQPVTPPPVTQAAAPTPAAQQPSLTPEQLASQERLKENVTDAIDMACAEIFDKVEEREWFVNAHRFWHGDFKKAIVDATDDNQRIALINAYCDPQTWERLMGYISRDGEQLVKFVTGIHRLVEMNKPGAK